MSAACKPAFAAVVAAMVAATMPRPAASDEKFTGPLTAMPAEQQIRLAKSAAPPQIAEHATIYVLGPEGYVKARSGTNGFTCLVERQLIETQEPSCYDAEGSETTLQARLYREELRAAKVPEHEIEPRIEDGYRAGRFRAPGKPGFVYMLSTHNQVYNDRTNRIIHVPPHLMFYAPYANEKDFGGFLGPQWPYVVLAGRPDAYIIVAPALMGRALQQPAGDEEAGRHTHGK